MNLRGTMQDIHEIKAEKAWDDLMEASRQISREWKGPTALEEIRSQREKVSYNCI